MSSLSDGVPAHSFPAKYILRQSIPVQYLKATTRLHPRQDSEACSSMLTSQDVRRHASRGSCWVIISNHAYDVTDFLDQHPGGANTILRYAGKVNGS